MNQNSCQLKLLQRREKKPILNIEFKAPKGLEMNHLDGKWSYLISHPERPRVVFTQMLDWK